jgi:hypothetical protein
MGRLYLARRPLDAYTRIDPAGLRTQRFFIYEIDTAYADDHQFPVFESIGDGRVVRLDDPLPRHPFSLVPQKGWNYCLIEEPFDGQ